MDGKGARLRCLRRTHLVAERRQAIADNDGAEATHGADEPLPTAAARGRNPDHDRTHLQRHAAQHQPALRRQLGGRPGGARPRPAGGHHLQGPADRVGADPGVRRACADRGRPGGPVDALRLPCVPQGIGECPGGHGALLRPFAPWVFGQVLPDVDPQLCESVLSSVCEVWQPTAERHAADVERSQVSAALPWGLQVVRADVAPVQNVLWELVRTCCQCWEVEKTCHRTENRWEMYVGRKGQVLVQGAGSASPHLGNSMSHGNQLRIKWRRQCLPTGLCW